MTVTQLSALTGYSDKAINQWEQGRVNPKLWHLHDWAQALGFEVKVEKRK